MDVVRALNLCGGVARRPVLRSLGVSDAQLRQAVRRGLLQPAKGVYALPEPAAERVDLIVKRQLLTCASAARFYGLWLLHDPPLRHVHHLRAEDGGAVVHHGPLLLPPHPYQPVAALADVLVHALRCLPWQDALVMVECAVSRGDMTIGFLRERLPGNRNGKAREVLRWVGSGAESLTEVLARTCFRMAGIHVEAQFHVHEAGHFDLLLEGWLLVEIDGRHHAEWSQVKKDHRRSNLSLERGYVVLHYYYDDVVYSPAKMVAQVLSVLARGRKAWGGRAA